MSRYWSVEECCWVDHVAPPAEDAAPVETAALAVVPEQAPAPVGQPA
jgi:hypothetical protein